jgi:hypothetical protein
MFDQKNIKKILSDFDMKLGEKNDKREITIFGSASLLLQSIARKSRTTIDIDVIEPFVDDILRKTAAEVAEKLRLPEEWLNSAGHFFSKDLPEGWQKRTRIIYHGKNLTVRSLGREDLISTKFDAYCDRDKIDDLNDLIDLEPTNAEFQRAVKWVLSLKDRVSNDRIEKCSAVVSEKLKGLSRGR